MLRRGGEKDETEYLQSSIPIRMGRVCPQHSNLQKPALYMETEETQTTNLKSNQTI